MLKPLLQKFQNRRIILASGSKQRATLLASTVSQSPHRCRNSPTKLRLFQHLNFEVYPSKFEENLDAKKYSIEEYVQNTALGKVNDVFEQLKNDKMPPDIIIGADTMVALNNKMYGKPKTRNDAYETIKT